MKKILFILVTFLLGCVFESTGTQGRSGTDCFISGTNLLCGDGSSFDLSSLKGDKGDTGSIGPQGSAGINGSSCSMQGFVLSCPDGSSFDFATLKGTDGIDGANGTSCTVVETLGGALIMCSDGSETFISNGSNNPPSDASDKTELCHLPPGNPTNQRTLWVGSQSAVNAHLAHGDYLGACITQ